MPATVQTTTGGLSFNDVLDKMVARLESGAVPRVAAGSVRRCFTPDAQVGEYLGQEGLVLRVRPPDPFTRSGGGRWAYMLDRTVDVFVVTMCLRDVGGRDEVAMRLHIAREEAVLDALHDQPPVGSAQNLNAIGVTIKHAPGGQEIMRALKTDAGLNVSVVPLTVTYQAPLSVLRV